MKRELILGLIVGIISIPAVSLLNKIFLAKEDEQ